jgi:hypothetical protein
MQNDDYPITLNIEYPEKTSRLLTFFRYILMIPAFFIFGFCIIPMYLIFPFMFLIVTFTKIYPRWMFNYNVFLNKLMAQLSAYMFFLTDNYPLLSETNSVQLDIKYPERQDLHYLMPIIKFLLAIPHFIVLAILGAVMYILYPITWIVIVILGRYPRPLFNYFIGFLRWQIRVNCYYLFLFTDKYPPFGFE